MSTADEFCSIRAKAIIDYGASRNTKWSVLGVGRFRDLGAVRVQDQYGTVGLVVQSEPGSVIGMTMALDSAYIEQ